MAQVAKAATMAAEISPVVGAPASAWTFWAPTATLVPASAAATVGRQMAGRADDPDDGRVVRG
jgi:hypothetical protein